VRGYHLRGGRVKSCGCLRKEKVVENGRTNPSNLQHGMCGSPTYISWENMRQRCDNPNATGWERWGGRGITLCERWDSFENFLADMGERPEGTTLDRIDNDGNYEPGNCKWSTSKEQQANTRPRRRQTPR
jgi:hypothetical protein